MKAIITGHKGYIGGNLYKELLRQGHEVAGIDLKGCSIGGKELPGEDICDGFPVDFYEFHPDVIFHLAAIPRVEYSVQNPVIVMKNNVLSTSVTMKFAKFVGAPVVYSSSSSVVGNGSGPCSPYALSKYVGEMEALMYTELYKVKAIALRYFNVYSYDQEADSEYATVVCNWKKYILEGRTPYITGDGEQRRDMTHVDDVVSANIFCANNINKEDLWGHWYDVGSGENISLNELKEIVKKHFPGQSFDYRPPRAGDVDLTKADLSKFNSHGWNSKVKLSKGLSAVYERLLNEDLPGER
jgi:nucleoside-diphosphate-sugar epimerase